MDELLAEIARIDELNNLRANCAKSFALIRALKLGEVNIESVSLTADGWQVRSSLLAEKEPNENDDSVRKSD